MPESSKDDHSTSEQRRTSPRVAQKFMLRYRSTSQLSWHLTTLRDLSRDGVRFLSEQTFNQGQALELQFGLPLFPQTVRVNGRVAWKKVLSGSLELSEYGVALDVTDPAILQTFEQAVERFLKAGSQPPSKF